MLLFVCSQSYLGVVFARVPALFGAVVGQLERAPDSQDECSAPLVCEVEKVDIWHHNFTELKLMSVSST